MASTNKKKVSDPIFTHEGGRASKCSNLEQLRRTVTSAFLWESGFYEDGKSIASRVESLVPKCSVEDLNQLVIELRTKHHLRHMPLYICKVMANNKMLKADVLTSVIQRADEMAEFLSLYWKDGKSPIAKQVKLGLAKSFSKFNEYQFAKYKGDGKTISLRDVMFMVRPNPSSELEAELFKKIADKNLETPLTWETQLSSGRDKKEVFTELIEKNALGGLAFLRNLRNMINADVKESLIKDYFTKANFSKVLPFRFIASYRSIDGSFANELSDSLLKSVSELDKLNGSTCVLVDVSGSMESLLSSKSDLRRLDAAVSLAGICTELCDDCDVFTFSYDTVKVEKLSGKNIFQKMSAIDNSQTHGATYLSKSINYINSLEKKYDRIIIITDEQSADGMCNPLADKGYLINVACDKNGVAYNKNVTHINGFSENVFKFISSYESL
jgi:hypothetical protein